MFNIGCSYAYLEDFKNAEIYYKKSLKIDPNFQLCKRNLSILYLHKRNYQNAWKYFDGRIGLDEFRHKNNIIHNIKNKLWNGIDDIKNKKMHGRASLIKELKTAHKDKSGFSYLFDPIIYSSDAAILLFVKARSPSPNTKITRFH